MKKAKYWKLIFFSFFTIFAHYVIVIPKCNVNMYVTVVGTVVWHVTLHSPEEIFQL